MTRSPEGPQGPEGPDLPTEGSVRPHRRRRWWILGVVAALVVALVGYGAFQYHSLDSGIRRSSALAGAKQSTRGDTNLLVMGLDSRLDENGDPLPKAMYDALHTGDASIGGLNTNVLMLVHIPGDGSRATAISIPRDDYVDFVGCPDGECKGKIKEAYGLAYDQEQRHLAKQGVTGHAANQHSREAGRRTEIATVQQFLGGVAIDHFVEVTMVAFYQIAQNVQPIQSRQGRHPGHLLRPTSTPVCRRSTPPRPWPSCASGATRCTPTSSSPTSTGRVGSRPSSPRSSTS